MIPIIYLYWQRPNIKISFYKTGSSISCRVQNLPHTNKWLRWLNRDAIKRLTAKVCVKDLNIDDEANPFSIIVNDMSARIIQLTDDRPPKNRFVELIASSELYANILIAYKSHDEEKVLIVDKDYACAKKVDGGIYTALIEVCADNTTIKVTRDFVVEYQHGYLYVKWVNEDAKKKAN